MLTMEVKGEMLILRRPGSEIEGVTLLNLKRGDWRRWRGLLKETSALQDHEREHDEEVKSEKSP